MELFCLAASTTAPADFIKTIELRTRHYSFTDRLGRYSMRENMIPFTTAAIGYHCGQLCQRPREGGSK
jgi:hypothetical protein